MSPNSTLNVLSETVRNLQRQAEANKEAQLELERTGMDGTKITTEDVFRELVHRAQSALVRSMSEEPVDDLQVFQAIAHDIFAFARSIDGSELIRLERQKADLNCKSLVAKTNLTEHLRVNWQTLDRPLNLPKAPDYTSLYPKISNVSAFWVSLAIICVSFEKHFVCGVPAESAGNQSLQAFGYLWQFHKLLYSPSDDLPNPATTNTAELRHYVFSFSRDGLQIRSFLEEVNALIRDCSQGARPAFRDQTASTVSRVNFGSHHKHWSKAIDQVARLHGTLLGFAQDKDENLARQTGEGGQFSLIHLSSRKRFIYSGRRSLRF